MRVSVQRCLILGLCFFSHHIYAADSVAGAAGSGSGSPYVCPESLGDSCHVETYSRATDTEGGTGQYWRAFICNGGQIAGDVHFQTMTAYGENYKYPVSMDCWIEPPPQCVALSHEPNPITGEVGATNEEECSCASGWFQTSEPVDGGYDCALPEQPPEECYENGQIFDPNLGYCVLQCPSGQLNGVCLQDTADNEEECTASSPDFKGSIGFGNNKQNICESDITCEGGSLGIVNDIQVCVPDEYGPPTCPADGVLVMDEYGYVCEGMNDIPEEPETPEEPNTDTDGDGEPDEYKPENDPNSTDKAIDGVSGKLDKTNDGIEKSNQRLDKINKSLDGIGKDLNQGLDAVNDNLTSIEEGMVPPDGGFSPDGFEGLVPTFSESMIAFKASVMTVPAVQIATNMANLPESNNCPVYTIPATPVSGPLPLSVHCEILQDYRGVISALFLFFWAGTALFVFLRA